MNWFTFPDLVPWSPMPANQVEPGQNDTSLIIVIVAVAIVVAGSVFALVRKKKRDN